MRVIFMGTPDFSVPTQQALADAGHEIVACYSQPPRPAGRRGLELKASPVHQAADVMGVPVHTPTSLKSKDALNLFRSHDADVAVVVAYGMLLPQVILDVPSHGCLNGHASLLPRWRGAAPIQRAIMAGDDRTGVQVMRMEAGLDTGPVGHSTELPINDSTTAGELHDALAQECATAMVEALAKLQTGTLTFTSQSEEGITYASKISKDETRVNFAEPAHSVLRHIHGLSPFPGAWCEMEFQGKAQRVKLLRCELAQGSGAPGTVLDDGLTIACGSGAIRLTHVQKAGSKPADAATFLRGNAIAAGTILP